MSLVRFANHAKQSGVLILSVNRPLRIKNLMAAVFRISLCKHHQFHIRGIAFGFRKSFGQVINFIFAHRQTHGKVGVGKRLSAFF